MKPARGSRRPIWKYAAVLTPIVILAVILTREETASFRAALQVGSQNASLQVITAPTESIFAPETIEHPNFRDDDDGAAGSAATASGAPLLPIGEPSPIEEKKRQTSKPFSNFKTGTTGGNGGKEDAYDKNNVHRFLGKNQDDYVEDVLQALGNCTDLHCAIQSHDRLRGRTRFHLPHFVLAGWARAGGIQVLRYLDQHPQFLRSLNDNPHYFTACKSDPDSPMCAFTGEGPYLRDVMRVKEAAAMRLEVATADTSDDYAARGAIIARRLYRLFPWIKVVLLMREPFSRIVMHQRSARREQLPHFAECAPGSVSFLCMLERLRSPEEDGAYYQALEGWLFTFPTDQLFVVQYEELKENPNKVLYDLRLFLGLDPDSPELEFSMGETRSDPEPVEFGKGQYLRLARMAKEDALRSTNLMQSYGLIDKVPWMTRWEAIWRGNEARCGDDGQCKIVLGLD